jgi:predicted YcjX-like family ATPase
MEKIDKLFIKNTFGDNLTLEDVDNIIEILEELKSEIMDNQF